MNNLEELKDCLAGFEKQTYRNFRIFVCVDGSTDGTNEFLSEAKLNFEMIPLQHPENKHCGRNETRNLAIKYLDSEYLLMFDSDIVPDVLLLAEHAKLLEQKDCISVGEVYYKNHKTNIWADYLHHRGKGQFADDETIPAYYLNTQNVGIRTRYFLESGGQDPNLTHSYGGDDTELGYRLGKDFNLTAVFNKKAFGHSILDKSLDKALMQMREFGEINLHLIRKKHPEFREIFHFDLADGKSIKAKTTRFFLKNSFAFLAKGLLPTMPRAVSLKIVHYLVFQSILSGFYSKNN